MADKSKSLIRVKSLVAHMFAIILFIIQHVGN